MAYAVAVILSKALRKLHLCDDPFSVSANYPKLQIEIIREGVDSLKKFLVENRDVKGEFEGAIRDAIYEAQDVIDSNISTHFLSPETGISQSFYGDLETVIQKITSLVEMATSEKFTHQTLNRKISNSVWKRSEEINCRKSHTIVGRDKDLSQVMDRLVTGSEALEVIPVVGIAGMGKTTIINCVIEDESIRKHFRRCCGVGLIKYNKRGTMLSLLGYSEDQGDELLQKTDEQLAKLLYNSLKHDRYLVILDNIPDVSVWNDLKGLFPNYYIGSRILITTSNLEIAHVIGLPHQLDRLSDEDTLALLQDIVLNDEPFPDVQLEVIAKDIAQSCRGLPHAVVIIGRLLLCAELSSDYWEMVSSSVNTCGNYADLMEAAVALTYKHLPQQLKSCLMYMATFPYHFGIHRSTLSSLCEAEGFIDMDNSYTKSEGAVFNAECLMPLYDRDLVSMELTSDCKPGGFKIYEQAFYNFIVRKAEEEKFFTVINKDTDYAGVPQEERRLCIRKNIVPLVMKDLPDFSILRKSVSTVRSLLYRGPDHRYPLRAWLEDFKLLRVLDAGRINFCSFPHKILQFIHLRYLILRYNGELPAAVYKLHNLQVLIVESFLTVKNSGTPSFLPMQIWNMKELRYLCVTGSNLPDTPTSTDLVLENLTTLEDVSVHSCTPQILKRLIQLKKLCVLIESLHEDESLSFFSHLHILHHLAVFECNVRCPDTECLQLHSCIPSFPSQLEQLDLSGCVFPWEYMRVIAELPNLEFLKLRRYAFHGPEWEVKMNEFPKLISLVLEDMGLENWTIVPNSNSFPALVFLVIRHCYKLHQIPLGFGDSVSRLEVIKVIDCSIRLVNSAMQIKEMLSAHDKVVTVSLYSSVFRG